MIPTHHFCTRQRPSTDSPLGGPQLVFLPYFGGSEHSWDWVWPHLPSDYVCLALNPFTPESPLGEDQNGEYHIEIAATQLVDFLNDTITGSFWLVGHSMGGKLALTAAPQLSQLQGLILVAPSPPTPEPMSDIARAAMLERHGTREGALQTIQLASFVALEGEKLEQAIAADLATPSKDWQNWLHHGAHQDVTSIVKAITVPVFILGGEEDRGFTPQVLQNEVVANLPLARVEMKIIEGSGHLIPLESPQLCAQQMAYFIARQAEH